jgi:hypothetical protein
LQPIHLQLFDLKQPLVAHRQRSSSILANSIEAYLFKAPKAVAQRQRSSPIPANSIEAYLFIAPKPVAQRQQSSPIAAHRFEASSDSEPAQ